MHTLLNKSGTSKSFSEKQQKLFDQLEDAAKKNKLSHHQEEAMDTDFSDSRRTPRNRPMRDYKRTESIFKRPEAPINRCLPYRRKSSFDRNPKTWTKYTLSDVKDDDMSDQANKRAAFSFLRELENRNAGSHDEEKVSDLPEKIVFKKSSTVKKTVSESSTSSNESSKAMYRSSKLVMPEYVIGQKQEKPKQKKVDLHGKSKNKTKELKLDHLLEEDDG